MVGRFPVITLCGSTRFKEQYLEVQKRLTLEGNIIISVGLFGHSGDEETWEPVEQRRLFAYCAGELIFRGEEHPYEYLLPESKAQHMDYSQL